MKSEALRHGIVLVGYFLLITLLRWQWQFNLVGLWLGGTVGFLMVQLDRLVYAYFLYPHEQLSQQIQYYIQKRDFRQGLALIYQRRKEQRRIVFRSFLFVVAWIFLAIFALTSKETFFAGGLVMGLGLHLVYDFWRDWQIDKEGFKEKVFWQIKRPVSHWEAEMFLYGFSGIFVMLSWILI